MSCSIRREGSWLGRKTTTETKKWWVSNRLFTVQANTQNGLIIWTAPIVHKFIGQSLSNLLRWIPNTTHEEIP